MEKKNEESTEMTKGKAVSELNQVPHHEGIGWNGGIAPHTLNFGTRWR
jgi:hypothetical protein